MIECKLTLTSSDAFARYPTVASIVQTSLSVAAVLHLQDLQLAAAIWVMSIWESHIMTSCHQTDFVSSIT
jgi:hypothetical protein